MNVFESGLAADQPNLDRKGIDEQLSRIVGSQSFRRAPKQADLLEFLVEKALTQEHEAIKEYIVGVEFFKRPSSFDPATDTIVRTTAQRLRTRLKRYYRTEGVRDQIIFRIPTGHYIPEFTATPKRSRLPHDAHEIALEIKARQRYAEGYHFLHRHSGSSLWDGLVHFQQSFQNNPDDAPSLVGIASCYVLLSVMGELPGKEAWEKAHLAATEALSLDPNCTEAKVTLLVVRGFRDWEWATAHKELKTIFQKRRTVAAHFLYGSYFLLPLGRFTEAKHQMELALRIQPNSPRLNLHLGIIYCCQREYDQAIAHFRESLEVHPQYPGFHFWLGRTYCIVGMYREALAELTQAHQYLPDIVNTHAYIAYASAQLGDTAAAEDVRSTLERLASTRYVPPHAFAVTELGLGRTNEVIQWLQKAADDRCSWLPLLLNIDPLFDSIRPDPRVQQILRTMNLPYPQGRV